ncbi:MAG: hypothetical protein QOI29_1755 [Mycobacterium sp.]|nr:hypothetical protein [Mycobacterium sp.]
MVFPTPRTPGARSRLWIERVLPDESELALVENGGHFLQLDQPDVVARHIVDFVGRAALLGSGR